MSKISKHQKFYDVLLGHKNQWVVREKYQLLNTNKNKEENNGRRTTKKIYRTNT